MTVLNIMPGDRARRDNGQVIGAIAPAVHPGDWPDEDLPEDAAPAPEAGGRGAVVIAFRRRKARRNGP